METLLQPPIPETPERIAAYLGDSDVNPDVHTAALIDTAVRIIGMYDTDSAERDADLVAEAADNIFQWMGDYGIQIEGYMVA